MNPGGIVLIVAGLWLFFQVVRGKLIERIAS